MTATRWLTEAHFLVLYFLKMVQQFSQLEVRDQNTFVLDLSFIYRDIRLVPILLWKHKKSVYPWFSDQYDTYIGRKEVKPNTW